MSKKIITLLIFAAVVLAAVVTCPDGEAHKAAVTDKINAIVGTELGADSDSESTDAVSSLLDKGLNILGSAVASKVVETLVDTSFKTDDYVVFSLGKFSYLGKSRVVSVGVFGHVFPLFSEDDLKKAIHL